MNKPKNTMTQAIALLAIWLTSAQAGDNITLSCDYTTFSDETGLHKVTNEEGFKWTFIIDPDTGDGYAIGKNSTVDVIVTEHKSGGVTFIEKTPNNSINTTATDTKGISVHSRNTMINGQLVPSQYYGTCSVK